MFHYTMYCLGLTTMLSKLVNFKTIAHTVIGSHDKALAFR